MKYSLILLLVFQVSFLFANLSKSKSCNSTIIESLENGTFMRFQNYIYSNSIEQIETDTCKWLKTNAEWCYEEWSASTNNDIIQIRILGDTLIENRLCSKLYLFEEDILEEQSKLICYYDELSQLVFFYENNEFKLMYSFSNSIAVGDTIEYFLPSNFKYYDITSDGGFNEPLDVAYKYVYQGEEFVKQENGKMQRILITQSLDSFNRPCFSYYRIIEGVGPGLGFLGSGCSLITAGFGPSFRNFSSLDFDYAVSEGCLVTSVQDIDEASIQFFPNPTNDILNIRSDNSEVIRMRLFSSIGQKVLDEKVLSNDLELSVSDFATGVYLLDVELFGGASYREKILILGGE